MQYFRFLTKTKGQAHLQALVIQSASNGEAARKAKELMAEDEKPLSINVLRNDTWLVIKGAEIKNKTVKPHEKNEVPPDEVSPLGDAIQDEKFKKSFSNEKMESGNAASTPSSEGDGQAPAGADKAGDIAQMLVFASTQAFMVCVVRIFTIPWSIWKGCAYRLAASHDHQSNEANSDTEFPVFEWFKSAWDGGIFLSWVLGPFFTIMAANSGYRFDWGMMWGGIFFSYFGVILLSLTKEMLILILSIALNVEKLSNKANAGNRRSPGAR